jgi:tripartite-type tricarboxylate transporter receptor subunit TctC
VLLVMNRRRMPTTLAEAVGRGPRKPRACGASPVSSLGAAGTSPPSSSSPGGGDSPQVPYRGTAPALTDVVAGNVSMMFDPILATLPQVRTGRVRGIAITAPERSAAAPEIPTRDGGGMPGLDIQSWWALWGPRGLPAEVTARIGEVLRTGMFEPDVLARVGTLGITPKAEIGADFAAFIARDFARSQDLLRIANFQPE